MEIKRIFCWGLVVSFSLSVSAKDHGSSKRLPEKVLFPREFLNEMSDTLKKEKPIKKDLILAEEELKWSLKKTQHRIEELKAFALLHKNKLLPEEEKQFTDLLQELRLQEALLTRELLRISFKENDALAREADFALPPQLDPEIPKLFDENKVPKFIRPLPPVQPTIEPQ